MLRGALAASVTPLRDGGVALDIDAFAAVVDDLVGAGLDLLAFGTNGEACCWAWTGAGAGSSSSWQRQAAGLPSRTAALGATADTAALASRRRRARTRSP